MKFSFLLALLLASLSFSFAAIAAEDDDQPTAEMMAAIKKHWFMKTAVKATFNHYGHCDKTPYQAYVGPLDPGPYQNDADKEIVLLYACKTEKDGNEFWEEDSVRIELYYNSKKKEASNFSITQGPCTSDICGP